MQVENLVLVDQLLGRGDAFGRRASGVFLDDLELAAVNAALVVDVLEVSHQADLRLAVTRGIAGKGPHDADLDGRVGQAGLFVGAGRPGQQRKAREGG